MILFVMSATRRARRRPLCPADGHSYLAKGEEVPAPGRQLDEEAHVEDLITGVLEEAVFHDIV
jgi:hypothetical protein